MDLNPIDIKIKEFAIYLKDFGLLNETNYNDFLKKFKNVSENSIISSGIFETDINVGLIYLKENLSKTMLEFYGLMTEERKKITYLNIYSKFLKKREDELKTKGNTIYKIYSSLIIKKYFSNWKNDADVSTNNTKLRNKKNISIIRKKSDISNIIKDFRKDNFCFDIISNNVLSNNNNNVIINSNNNRILFNSNSSSLFNGINGIKTNDNSLINSKNNFNTFLLSSKNRLPERNLYNNSVQNHNNNNTNNNINISTQRPILSFKSEINYKPEVYNEKILDKLFHPNISRKEENSDYNNIDKTKSMNKSYNSMRHTTNQQKRVNNIKEKNNLINKNNIYSNLEKEEYNIKKKNNTPKMRNTYNSARPKSSFHSNDTKKSVYQRLYDQNKEKIKRQEERIKENINEIKERANHPIQKKNSFNNFRKNKKKKSLNNNIGENNNNDIYNNKYKITCEGENQTFFDKKFVSKKIGEALFDKSLKEKRIRYTSYNENKKENIKNEQKRKDGKNFIDSQRQCIELFNHMIENEEKKGGKIFNKNEKESMFKDLLNKIYKDIQNDKINNNENNMEEDSKINEDNLKYNKICESVEIKLKQ